MDKQIFLAYFLFDNAAEEFRGPGTNKAISGNGETKCRSSENIGKNTFDFFFFEHVLNSIRISIIEVKFEIMLIYQNIAYAH